MSSVQHTNIRLTLEYWTKLDNEASLDNRAFL
jgi:hypothetical protein